MRESSSVLSWVLPLGLLLFAIVFVPLRILEAEGLPRYRALRAELLETRAQNERTRRELHALQERVERMRSEPAMVERIARDELGMLKRGELIFQFAD